MSKYPTRSLHLVILFCIKFAIESSRQFYFWLIQLCESVPKCGKKEVKVKTFDTCFSIHKMDFEDETRSGK